MAARYVTFVQKFRYAIWAFTLAFTVGCVYLARDIKLSSSLGDLLPKGLPSLSQLKTLQDRVGGSGVLMVSIESPSFAKNKAFVEAMMTEIRQLPKEDLHYYEYRFKDAIDYIHKYGLHYLTNKQLRELGDKVDQELDKKKDAQFDSFLGIGEEEAPKAKLKPELAESFAKFQNLLGYPEGYVGTKDGKMLVIMLRPKGSSTSVNESRLFIAKINAIIAKLNPSSYDPKLTVRYAGNVQSVIEEFEAVKDDILSTALLLIVLLVAILYLFLWSFRRIGALMLVLLPTLSFSVAFTNVFIGQLNTLTAFFSSVVAGTAINYGVIFLMRYLSYRRQGRERNVALERTISKTAIGTLVGSTTTAAGFLALLASENRGFSDFGKIGGLSILLCWIVTYVIFPTISEWFDPPHNSESKNPLAKFGSKMMLSYGNFVLRHAKAILVVLAFVPLLLIPGFLKLFHDPLEYNFNNLKNTVSLTSGSTVLKNRIQENVYHMSLTPTVVLLNSEDQGESICKVARAIAKDTPPELDVLDQCLSYSELLPPHNEPLDAARKHLIDILRKKLSSPLLKYDESGTHLLDISRLTSDVAPLASDLPEQMISRFVEKDGSRGRIAYLYPSQDKPFDNAKYLLSFTQRFQDIKMPNGDVVHTTGDPFILADLLRNISHDGPLVSVLSFIAVILLAFLITRSIAMGAILSITMAYCAWVIFALQGYFAIRYNFINFVAVPLIFGLGIDYPVNMLVGTSIHTKKKFLESLGPSIAGVVLCSLTTFVGYLTLIYATNQALVSFAKLAMIGEMVCCAMAVVLIPAVMVVRATRGRALKES